MCRTAKTPLHPSHLNHHPLAPMKNIGLMGCGTVADYGHIPVILKTPGLRLAAL